MTIRINILDLGDEPTTIEEACNIFEQETFGDIKYVLGNSNGDMLNNAVNEHVALFIFPNHMVHADVMKRYRIEPIAAGFISIRNNTIHVTGHSESIYPYYPLHNKTTPRVQEILATIPLTISSNEEFTPTPEDQEYLASAHESTIEKAMEEDRKERSNPKRKTYDIPTHGANGKKLSWMQRKKLEKKLRP